MGFKFYFNRKAWETIAKQLRIASWGIGGIVTAGGFQLNNAWVLLASGITWLVLQVSALVLESIKYDGKEGEKK